MSASSFIFFAFNSSVVNSLHMWRCGQKLFGTTSLNLFRKEASSKIVGLTGRRFTSDTCSLNVIWIKKVSDSKRGVLKQFFVPYAYIPCICTWCIRCNIKTKLTAKYKKSLPVLHDFELPMILQVKMWHYLETQGTWILNRSKCKCYTIVYQKFTEERRTLSYRVK